MSQTEFALALAETFAALRRDLIHDDGPRISTMRNYRFAIVQHRPEDEFKIRREVQRLTADLAAHGWRVLAIDLHKIFLDRLRTLGDDTVRRMIAMERRMAAIDRARGLGYLQQKLAALVDGEEGIATDCSRIICGHADAHPDEIDRTLALIGRAGALHPFFRSSALLRRLDGHTRNVPVVLLYPGRRVGPTGLSFMGRLAADNDYRPRIY